MGRKILVLAYTSSPTRGAEHAVAWNYITEMSADNELVVLYGMSGNHMGEISELEKYIAQNPFDNVRFIPVPATAKPNA